MIDFLSLVIVSKLLEVSKLKFGSNWKLKVENESGSYWKLEVEKGSYWELKFEI